MADAILRVMCILNPSNSCGWVANLGDEYQNFFLILLTLTFKYILFPLNYPYFLKYLFLRKMQTRPATIYLLKVNNRNTRTRCEICSKLIIKTPERRLVPSFTLQSWYILLKIDFEKKILSFHPRKIYFVFLKQ